jgi:hypothetical protein
LGVLNLFNHLRKVLAKFSLALAHIDPSPFGVR